MGYAKTEGMGEDMKNWMWYALIVIVFLAGGFAAYYAWCKHLDPQVGQFGDLFAGTVGVAASIASLILLIRTLLAQQELNRQNEVNHLVQNFDDKNEKFTLMLKEQDEVHGTIERKIKHYWHIDCEDIRINSLLPITAALRSFEDKRLDGTKVTLGKTLEDVASSDAFQKLRNGYIRLYILGKEIESLNTKAYSLIAYEHKGLKRQFHQIAAFISAWEKNPTDNQSEQANFPVSSDYKTANQIPFVTIESVAYESFGSGDEMIGSVELCFENTGSTTIGIESMKVEPISKKNISDRLFRLKGIVVLKPKEYRNLPLKEILTDENQKSFYGIVSGSKTVILTFALTIEGWRYITFGKFSSIDEKEYFNVQPELNIENETNE